jgi:NitT/TauT family transport system permease protein
MLPTTLGKVIIHKRTPSHLIDLIIFGAGLALLYGLLTVARTWIGPFTPIASISRRPSALPAYAVYSLVRMAIAYTLSLIFTLIYGYIAAYNAKAERIMIPLLDILQSIPVLSFLPGVMLAMVALFPHSQLGVELGSILLIFTGQVWNMVFSFYMSLKTIPRDLHEVARIYRFSWWQRLTQIELPYATTGLVWNSIMSVAGGWFFLMACEMFVLGKRDFRLPGLGSYLQTAASAGDTHAIVWGLGTMIGIIVLIDQLIWRPVIAWADKFKFEQVESSLTPQSVLLNLLRQSKVLSYLKRQTLEPLNEGLTLFFAHRAITSKPQPHRHMAWQTWTTRALASVLLVAIGYGLIRAGLMISGLTIAELEEIAQGAVATFLRVNAALIISIVWTIPTGVAIGSNPRLASIALPLTQIAASVPATALFPVILLILISAGGGLGIGSVLLMLIGTQWYILFNVIAGAMAIPNDLKEAARIFRFKLLDRWRLLILPGIFPYLITGLITAAGGAWNASIVAEYFHFKGQTLSTIGLGAIISRASDAGNSDQLLVATIAMSAMVVAINRIVWRRLYHIAEIRFKLEV